MGDQISPDDLRALLEGFARERRMLIPALQRAQEALGYLPPWAMELVGQYVRVPASEVHGVASHYPNLRLDEPGRHILRVCTGVSCRVNGALALLSEAERVLGVRAGGTTPDRAVTLEEAGCCFLCSMAPVIEWDGGYRGRARPEGMAPLLALSSGPPAHPAAFPYALFGAGANGGRARRWEDLDAAARASAPRRPRLVVGAGSCAGSVGAGEVAEALREGVAARGLDAEVVEAGCNGMCHWAVAVDLVRPGRARVTIGEVTPASAGALVDRCVVQGRGAEALPSVCWADEGAEGAPPWRQVPFLAGQRRVLLERAGVVDPGDLLDAVRHGAYRALARALAMTPEAVIAEVKGAGLLGRGGAFFPAAVKWEGCRRNPDEPRYLVVNAEEGEPGIFKDRHLIEGDPHRLIEGMLIAAHAAGASRGVVFVNGEAPLALRRMHAALRQAEAHGLLGEGILGSPFAFRVELRQGAGGFILGEETAMLESIEGWRAMPRVRPPFPVESGLWGKPTVINNVETLMAVPVILERGAAWFAGLGTERARGTKVFGLSGQVARPGIVEVEMGCTLRQLVHEIGGGLRDGRTLKAVLVGGPSGFLASPADLDTPMEPRGGLSPGTGGLAILGEGVAIPEVVWTLTHFNADESCGKCTPCREGTARMRAILARAMRGAASAADRAELRFLGEVVGAASLCGLGQAAPASILSGLTHWGAEFGE
jgi:NADH:ubiquinone oxidoreductase subunit F (NADH-binding)/NADH:ubiquinone oxidoreductase subunit E